MKQFLRRISEPLLRDDLLLRVICFLGGTLTGGLGAFMSGWGATHHMWAQPLLNFLYWTMAILLMGYGGLMLSRCVLPARSRAARFLEGLIPDAVGLADAALLILLVYLPAVLLTLLLRLLGVKGQRSDWNRKVRSGGE